MYVTYNLCFCEAPAKELLGSKTGCQILQICKILNVLHISLYYGYFFKSMYSRHQMMATLSKYIPRKQPTHDAPRNNTLFLDLKYINLVKLQNTTCGKANFNIFIGLIFIFTARSFPNNQEFASKRTVSRKYLSVIYRNILTKFEFVQVRSCCK